MGDIQQADQSARTKADASCNATQPDCPKPPASKVLRAYFAIRKKNVSHNVDVTTKETVVTAANLAALSKEHGKIKVGDKVQARQEKESEVTTITYERISKAYVCDQVYIVVETADLRNGAVSVEVAGSRNTTFLSPGQVGKFLQGNAALSRFSGNVALSAEDKNASNAADLLDFAVLPIGLAPEETDPKKNTAAEDWGKKIDASAEKAAFLALRVTASPANGNTMEYANDDEKISGTTTDRGSFLNKPDSALQLLYWPCCVFKINDGYITSDKVKKDSISSMENAAFKRVNAIILHRTGGSTAAGAIGSFRSTNIGTHFVVDADGTITQTASLEKTTSHVGKIRSRCAATNSCNTIEAKTLKTLKTPSGIHEHETAKKYPERYPYNGDSVGIEVVGKSYDKDKKAPKTGDDVESWDALSEGQIKSVACLVNNLMTLYSLSRADIYLHEQISYKGKLEGGTVYDAISTLLK